MDKHPGVPLKMSTVTKSDIFYSFITLSTGPYYGKSYTISVMGPELFYYQLVMKLNAAAFPLTQWGNLLLHMESFRLIE
jgi:hypothetical protein